MNYGNKLTTKKYKMKLQASDPEPVVESKDPIALAANAMRNLFESSNANTPNTRSETNSPTTSSIIMSLLSNIQTPTHQAEALKMRPRRSSRLSGRPPVYVVQKRSLRQ